MREKEVLERAFAVPLTNPAYPPGPYRFVNREYLIITYRNDPARLRAVVPEPPEPDQREALVKYEFIRMPDGFGEYTGERSGDPGLLARPQRQLHALRVPQRRGSDRRGTRTLVLPEETGRADAAN